MRLKIDIKSNSSVWKYDVSDRNGTSFEELPGLKIMKKYSKCSLICLVGCYFIEILIYLQ